MSSGICVSALLVGSMRPSISRMFPISTCTGAARVGISDWLLATEGFREAWEALGSVQALPAGKHGWGFANSSAGEMKGVSTSPACQLPFAVPWPMLLSNVPTLLAIENSEQELFGMEDPRRRV